MSTMDGNDQVLSTKARDNQAKLEGAGDNDSANTEKSLLTMTMQFATLFTPVFRHTYSV